ncbi:taste receptor type 2 member 1 [Lepus europaeus]|uniref:taste receptor type 2 member 1 n=1 Tax=Lepus europaeus TaxID=9983 RepID=UPI002B45B761|nr:taste receptor type 2 member 1 [Lepus europaeus]
MRTRRSEWPFSALPPPKPIMKSELRVVWPQGDVPVAPWKTKARLRKWLHLSAWLETRGKCASPRCSGWSSRKREQVQIRRTAGLMVIQLLLGIFANGIILVGNGIDVAKERKMAPLALLLSCLAVSRICLQLFLFYMNLFFLSLTQVSMFVENFVIVLFTNEVGLWLATWLGVFYCIKIANFHHPLFLWLKMRISRLLPWLVLGSLLCAAISSGICSMQSWMSFEKLLQTFLSKNATNPIKEISALSSFFVIGGFPFFIFLVAALLLILSLGRHTWQLRSSTVGTRFPRRSAHVRALLSVLSFLFLYFSHFVVVLLLSSQVFPAGSLMFMLCLLISGAYPSGHSVILILGNSKLKQNAKRLLLPCDRFQEPVIP